jgi:CRP/FNR family transcriptional regulator, anaerobic regulatory protein
MSAAANFETSRHASFDENRALSRIMALGDQRTIEAGKSIHRAGAPFKSVFYLRSGIAKRVNVQPDGREQILGFPLPGEILGLEAIGADVHRSAVVALDICCVYEIAYPNLESLMLEDPTVARLLYDRFAASMRSDQNWLTVLGVMTAEERVAAFLLDLSRRYAHRGYSGNHFVLRMTRADIGRFLGLTLETVSRVFSKFQRNGWVNVQCRDVEIANLNAIALLAEGDTAIRHART